jgi:tetratricopeptide (TPR) repeat protein
MIFERMRTWVIETTEAARIDDPDNLELLNSLAVLYRNQGQYTKAEPLYVACLEQRRIALGEFFPSTLQSMNNLAALYARKGQYAEAESMFEDCLSKMEVVLGADHPDTIRTRKDLDLLRSMKK